MNSQLLIGHEFKKKKIEKSINNFIVYEFTIIGKGK
mgnify:CR=1 FL=1